MYRREDIMQEVNMRTKLLGISLLTAALIFCRINCFAENDKDHDALQIVANYSYVIGAEDSKETYEALGLFGARLKAVSLAAKYFVRKGLLTDYGAKTEEIFCLAAHQTDAAIIEQGIIEKGRVFYVKVKATVGIVDFIKADIRNKELDQTEEDFSWREEMEQDVLPSIDPARELSRAYRYLGKKRWRMAIIYLDHLQKKYPNWSELYLAKAHGLYATHNRQGMMAALRTSCSLGNREACEDLEGMTQVP